MAALYLFLVLGMAATVLGHGYLAQPSARGSRWRVDKSAPTNYDDSGLYCGGRSVQWDQNGGKCGLCGDNWALATPRPNELGGQFGQGVIVGSYAQGGALPVSVRITANHLGYVSFQLCNLDQNGGKESEACFAQHQLTIYGGSETKIYLTSAAGYYNFTLQLPKAVKCEHCVLRWTYTTGNSWGLCSNGVGAIGCGPQETFITCSDISVGSASRMLSVLAAPEEAPLEVENVV